MTTDDITRGVLELVARHIDQPVQAVPPDAPLADRGVDSLKIVALIVDIESHFGVRLPAALITKETFRSVESIAAALSTVEHRR